MKKPYFKKVGAPLGIVVALISTLFIIHSCKKEIKLGPLSTAADSLTVAKNWYESTYPGNSASPSFGHVLASNPSASATANNADNDFSRHIKPDWVHNASYRRFNKAVIETPVDPSSGAAFALKNNNKNTIVYSKENSKTSFLVLNNGANYSAYVMIIMGDTAYTHGDKAKLARNTYRHREADFSGMVFYFTPTGQFVRSYLYKNGKMVVPAISAAAPVASAAKTAAGQTGLAAASKFANRTLTTVVTICTDWSLVTDYYDYLGNFQYETKTYLYTTCADYSDGDGGVAGGVGGGGSPGAPPQCPPSDGSTNDASRVSILAGRTLDSGDGTGDTTFDTGFPDPDPAPGTTSSGCLMPVDTTKKVDTIKTPCAIDSVLSKNQAFIAKMNSFKSHLDDDHTETGYKFTDPSDPSSYIVVNGDPTSGIIEDLNVGTAKIAGEIHDHPDSIMDEYGQLIPGETTPSATDIQTMYTLYKNNNMIDPTQFIAGVLSGNGTAFIVTITDTATFAKWAAANFVATGSKSTKFSDALTNSYIGYANSLPAMGNDLSHVLALLDNLAGSGLTLSTANFDNLNNWKPLTKSGKKTYSNVNCNN